MAAKEIRVVTWSDRSITVLTRDKKEDGKLSDFVEHSEFSESDAQLLRVELATTQHLND